MFIEGSGQAIIVLDVIINADNSEKQFRVAQSYMPAQDIHILKNPLLDTDSPWYGINIEVPLQIPEWAFDLDGLMRFED